VTTLVCFHAHPDDEALTTSGTMARAARAGHRVVLVVATGGEQGEVPDDLAPDETLADRRRTETLRSADLIGVARVAWLGYRDSGMNGWQQNADPASFHQADLDEAGARLAALLVQEHADVLTIYDWHGGYGHPDHIKVHEVGVRAAELADTPDVYEATFNHDAFVRAMVAARDAGIAFGPPDADPDDFDSWTDDGRPFGSPEAVITTAVDVSDVIGVKRSSLMSHRSQVTDTTEFLKMPEEWFLKSFGTEWFIHRGAEPGIHEHELAGLT
jgi:LmbE family N-acetylglucosaminyl deacetylase